MPELPEVHTTVTGLDSVLPRLTILDTWTDYDSKYFYGKDQIKDPAYFKRFKKKVKGKKILSVSRRAKNILIHLESNLSILVHMKMTGHLMYGDYRRSIKVEVDAGAEEWQAKYEGPLSDPFNRFIHFTISLSNGKTLVLSDMRKFAKVTLIEGDHDEHIDITDLGPEPLSHIDSWQAFKQAICKKPNSKMKQVLMDPYVIAGIGNIYSDEILWASSIHPLRTPSSIADTEWKSLFKHTQAILLDSISKGGDSLSDYRNAFGEKGGYQDFHKAYRQTNQKCPKKGCAGIIERIVVGGRSTHFCPLHQK